MNRKIIILVFGMFALPVIVAILLNSRWIDWSPGGTKNFGEFISPVIPLPEGPWKGTSGQTVSRDSLLDKWQLVHVRRSACDEACLEDLYWLRQTRQSQDRHVPDVGLLLISQSAVDTDVRDLIMELSDTFQIIDGVDAIELSNAFPGAENGALRFIVDPLGNIMMRYAEEDDPNDIRKDLHRLLTWTQRD